MAIATPKRWRFVRGHGKSCAIYFPGGILLGFLLAEISKDKVLTSMCHGSQKLSKYLMPFLLATVWKK